MRAAVSQNSHQDRSRRDVRADKADKADKISRVAGVADPALRDSMSSDDEQPDCEPGPPPPAGMPRLQAFSEAERRELQLERALENFYSTNLVSFDDTVSTFALEHAHELLIQGEHSLRQHELFQEFVAMLESRLEAFLLQHNSSTEELVGLARSAAERGKPWPCAEYLGAAADFQNFLALVDSAARMQGWTMPQLG